MTPSPAERYPAALPGAVVWETWPARASEPHLACASAWSEACRAWWHHPADRRLRQRVVDTLFVEERELGAWQAHGLDETSLLQAHEHVTAARTAFESTSRRRVLTAGALRTERVVAYQRSGLMTVFAEAAQVPRLVATLAETHAALPAHPFVRAAWLAQAIGAVHPFTDANGGTLRFLASIELARAHLPPFVLTELQRNSTYASAIVEADDDLGALQHLVYDVVQQELGALLLADGPAPAEWTEHAHARAAAMTAHADISLRTAAALPLAREDANPSTLARVVRRGYRVPHAPAPHLVRWGSDAPVPWQCELVIAPVRAGDDTWMVASLAASIGPDGALGPLVHPEPIATVFVAAPTESDALVDERFARWLAARVDHCLRGLAAWM